MLILLALARAMVRRKEVIFGFPIVQAKGRERIREEIKVWNLYVWNFGMGTITNPSLSKLRRKNPNRIVVGWYKMSFVVYFEFCLS